MRKPIQIAACSAYTVALCDDGTIWIYQEVRVYKEQNYINEAAERCIINDFDSEWFWKQMPSIPQEGSKDDAPL